MPTHQQIARDLYDAFARADGERLLAQLHPDFVGHVAAGMPGGVGGEHRGAERMLANVWIPVWRRFGAHPVADEFRDCSDGSVIVTGRYCGALGGSGNDLSADFAHTLTFTDGRVSALHQVTDTERWHAWARAADIAVVKRMFEAVEHRDADILLGVYAADVRISEAPGLPYGGIYDGHEDAIRHGLGYIAAWDPIQTREDRRLEPRILHAGELIVVTWHQKATAPDGTRFDGQVVDLIELHEGLVRSLSMFHHDTRAVAAFLAHAESTPGRTSP